MTGAHLLVPVAALTDGTAYFAPVGEMLVDGDRVCCHLCGRWFLSVASHLAAHGWRKQDYIAAFGLEFGNPLTGEATRKRRATAFVARRLTEPVLQRAEVQAMARARSGALTAAATEAARGRPHPAQRRAKTLATLSGITREARAEGSRTWARRRREQIASDIAARHGFAEFADYLRDRLAKGASLAAVSREAGLHKDWVSRQLTAIDPDLARGHRAVRPHHTDLRLRPVAIQHGFPDVASYLRTRHVEEHRSIASLASEADVSSATILAAMRHNGLQPERHATKRHQARQRNETVARSLGFDTIASYVAQRRASGATWQSLVDESGITATTLRRQSR